MTKPHTKARPTTQPKTYQAQIKYRLTGAVIIVGFAIIVISVLLKPPTITPTTQSANPTDSTHRTLVLDLLDAGNVNSVDGDAISGDDVDKLALLPKTDTLSISAQNQSVVTSAKSIKEDKKSIPTAKNIPKVAESSRDISKDGHGWVVRVGTYSKIENVNKVSALLEKHGFDVQQTKVQTTLGAATRIWLGPYTKKKTAEKVSLRLNTINGEKGYVTKQS